MVNRSENIQETLRHLSEAERKCVLHYLKILSDTLKDNLCEVWLYGSCARGDIWGPTSPMHSDVDLLILTESPVPEDVQEFFINATYPLFLECGRQIAPQLKTYMEFREPKNDRSRDFKHRVQEEGKLLLYTKTRG